MLYLLGTGAALSDARRTTTMLAFSDGGRTVVVDCGGDLVQRMLVAGLDPTRVDALVITHEHPDHVGGFPLFMLKIWLAGRRDDVHVYGIAPALDQARRLFHAFETVGWTGLPDVVWHEVEQSEGAAVYGDEVWEVTAAPGDHSVPCVGLRVVHRPSGKVCAYSCDTRPTPPIARLARGADVLVHEATGEGPGHSSAAQAARVAAEAGAGRLVLVHLPPDAGDAELAEARAHFARVTLGADGHAEAF